MTGRARIDDERLELSRGSPPHGALFVFRVDDPAEVEAFVGADPYVGGGIVTGHRVVPWNVVI